MGGGGLILSGFLNYFFFSKNIFSGCLSYGLGDTKPVGTPVSKEIWLYFKMQKKIIPKIYFFYCFYEWKEGGQNQSPAIEYEGKKHPIKSKANKSLQSAGGIALKHL